MDTTERTARESFATTTMMTLDEMAVEIAERERNQRDDRALTRACIAAILSSGERLPRMPSLRVAITWCPNGHPLPSDWAVIVEPGEVPFVVASLAKPYTGVVAAIAHVDDLPKPTLTDAERERIVDELVEALLREIP